MGLPMNNKHTERNITEIDSVSGLVGSLRFPVNSHGRVPDWPSQTKCNMYTYSQSAPNDYRSGNVMPIPFPKVKALNVQINDTVRQGNHIFGRAKERKAKKNVCTVKPIC